MRLRTPAEMESRRIAQRIARHRAKYGHAPVQAGVENGRAVVGFPDGRQYIVFRAKKRTLYRDDKEPLVWVNYTFARHPRKQKYVLPIKT